ncbi:glycosyltransferase [Actinoplanes oblitus]|uniref:Glycosyltransferase n=1 Tax=Actinoplanes oblitus TaxID=3040509 RepID=A0ABY8W5C4_9ACTN|nr:glycosyltransferase [Actinoplanes oblitus]WIM92888.1 glycosyltransferase [Actinoplanes oblitus]
MTITVLHVAQPTEAGVARYVLGACQDQHARGWLVTAACPDGGRLADGLARAGIPRRHWAATRGPGFRSLTETVRLRELIRSVRPDVLHLHASKAGLAGRLWPVPRLPILFQPHGWSWLAVDGALRRACVAWERAAARRTALLICVGEDEAEQGRQRGVRGRYAIIRNGVDLTEFRLAGATERAAARRRLGVPAGVPLAVCPGRLTRQKGQDVLLTAWPAVRHACPDAHLALIGDGELAEPLHARATPGVTFAGAVDDVRDWLAAADVVALPSRWEGLSLALLEAMATGRGVVASDVPGLREALGPGAGQLVAAGDPVPLAHGLITRLRDPAARAAEGAEAARQATRFDLRRTYQQLAAHTEQVLQ